SSRRRHTRSDRDWSSDVCSSDLVTVKVTDDDGGVGTDTLTVAVANVAPVVTPPDVDAPANQGATEGSVHTFTIGSFTDAGINDEIGRASCRERGEIPVGDGCIKK